MKSETMRANLRRATRHWHVALENHLDLGGTHWTEQSYCRLLAKFWGLYSPLEAKLEKINWDASGLSLDERRKTGWLETDLAHFGLGNHSICDLERCRDLPRLDSLESGLGALYVMEGSTLGGQIVLKTLERLLSISPNSGGRYFASYGSEVGAMWRDYLAVLEEISLSTRATDQIVAGAIETFSAFDRWFTDFRFNAAQGSRTFDD